MRYLVLACAILAVGQSTPIMAGKPAAPKTELRCGWIDNPTPANWWLTDRHGQWLMMAMGGHEAPGMEHLPDMSTGQWVKTNGYYGYGCGCMRVSVDAKAKRITRIYSARQVPLRQCRRDPRLPKR